MKKNNLSPRKVEPIRVGFDFDGVVMYNPLRVIRPLMSFLKLKKLVKKEQLTFFQPRSKGQKFFWWLAHQTSLFPATGMEELRSLVESGRIEAFLITGRSSFLNKDLREKLKMYDLTNIFSKIFITDRDEQPHLFKEKMIKQLNLKYFIEDNWDIVMYLGKKLKASRLLWIYNIADRSKRYRDKYPNLKAAIKGIVEEEGLS